MPACGRQISNTASEIPRVEAWERPSAQERHNELSDAVSAMEVEPAYSGGPRAGRHSGQVGRGQVVKLDGLQRRNGEKLLAVGQIVLCRAHHRAYHPAAKAEVEQAVRPNGAQFFDPLRLMDV